MGGINTVCINDHEIGVECSDCWMVYHYVHVPPENVDAVEGSAPGRAFDGLITR